VNPTVGADGANSVMVEVIVLEVGFAFAGKAKLAINAELEIATRKVLRFLFILRPSHKQFDARFLTYSISEMSEMFG